MLGHSDRELERLSTQARLIDPITRRFFVGAGIGPGMRVLDVGSGAGDVAMLVSELVGASGEVVGTDISTAALTVARARVERRGLSNVTFIDGDPAEMAFTQLFDAVVGRYILQFIDDPVGALGRLAAHLRPGGLVAFHELDWDGARSLPESPTYRQCCQWVSRTIGLLGADTSMGAKLHTTFVTAGLSAPTMRVEATIGAGEASWDCVHLVTDLAKTLGASMERLGVASAAELDLETLAERIHDEIVTMNSVILGRSEIGAWSRVTGPLTRAESVLDHARSQSGH